MPDTAYSTHPSFTRAIDDANSGFFYDSGLLTMPTLWTLLSMFPAILMRAIIGPTAGLIELTITISMLSYELWNHCFDHLLLLPASCYRSVFPDFNQRITSKTAASKAADIFPDLSHCGIFGPYLFLSHEKQKRLVCFHCYTRHLHTLLFVYGGI